MLKYVIGGLLVIVGTIVGIVWFIGAGLSGASAGWAIGGVLIFVVIVLIGKYLMRGR